MLSRRRFLVFAGSALVLPAGLALSAQDAVNPFNGGLAVANADPECRDFQAGTALGNACAGIDDGPYLRHVIWRLNQSAPAALIGLTRDSDFVILHQLAAEHGFQRTYCGRHRYDQGTLTHTLSGEGSVLRALEAKLSVARHAWGRALGAELPLIASSCAEEEKRSLSIAMARPRASAGYLVSWVFRKED